MDSALARSMNDKINMDSKIAGLVNDNINMDSTIAGSMNDNIRILLACFCDFSIRFWNSSTPEATSGAETAYLSITPEFIPGV